MTNGSYFSYDEIYNARHLLEVRATGKNTWYEQFVALGCETNIWIPYADFIKTGPIKLFSSISEMNSCQDVGCGDLALVYKMTDTSLSQSSQFNMVHLNEYANITRVQADSILNGDDLGEQDFEFTNSNGDMIFIHIVVEKNTYEMEEDEIEIEYMTTIDVEVTREDGYECNVDYSGGIGSLMKSDDNWYFFFTNDLSYSGSTSNWNTYGSILQSIFSTTTMSYTGVYFYDGNKWINAPGTSGN